jgi:dTDP-4-dehydrorhamnose reductase
MKVLVLGGTGLAGSALVHVLEGSGHTVSAPTRAEYDILKGPLPRTLLDGADAVVNAAVLKDLTDREAAVRVNAEFPHELARLCSHAGVKLVHLSSDGVFSGRGGPFDEASAPDPDDEYGAQKLAGEPSFGLVLRTSIIGPEHRGFEALLCWFLAQRGSVPGYADQLWNGVTSVALAHAIGNVMALGPLPNGVRHVFAEDVTKQELLIRIARAFGREMIIQPTRAPVARDRRLRTRYPEFLAACGLPSLDTQLAELPSLADERGHWRKL